MALDRERQLSALGALAAAAAHELGTPLGTIAVVAHEIARDLPGAARSRRCRAAAEREPALHATSWPSLRRGPEAEHGAPSAPCRSRPWSTHAAAPYRRPGDPFRAEATGEPPTLPASPELSHGLGTLVENAFEFARFAVEVESAGIGTN